VNAAKEGKALQRCIERSCGAKFEINKQIYSCPRCGGLLDVVVSLPNINGLELKALWKSRLTSMDTHDQSGVWRFRELLPFPEESPIVTLLEGNTPIYDAPRSARYSGLKALQVKHQGMNPTGSFKDTGITVAITQAKLLGAKTVICASTGNTAASLAAYSARADMQCVILVPHGQVSHAKLSQSLDYDATVLEIDGNFDDAMQLVSELAEDTSIYLMNSINPFRIEGQKTVAAELLEQTDWQVSEHVVVPGGNLGNSSALGKGFAELLELGLIDRMPRLSVVQADGAAPFARLLSNSTIEQLRREALVPVKDPQTLATAIKIGAPVSWKKSARAVIDSGGWVVSVSEQEIADAKAIIGRDGIGCEPASATTVAGLKKLVATGRIDPAESAIAILTGHALKDTDYTIKYHREALFTHDRARARSKEERHIRGTFANSPKRVKASKEAILRVIEHM